MRRMALAVTAVGVAVLAVGLVGQALGGGDGDRAADATPAASPVTTTIAPTVSPTSSPSPSPTTSPGPTTSPSPEESPEVFFDLFEDAVRSGDVGLLVRRLHPAVIDRYGRSQCRTGLRALTDPNFEVDVVSVGSPEPWVYERDGRRTPIEGSYAVQVVFRSEGSSIEQEAHVAPVDGELRWFADCGTPR